MPVISVAERNDVPSVDVAGTIGVAVTGIGRAGRSSSGIGTWFQGTYGAILLNADGSYTYRLDNFDPDTNVLGAGQTGEERFSYSFVENGTVRTGSLIVQVGGIDEADQQVTVTSSPIRYNTDTVLAANQRILSAGQYGVMLEGNYTDVLDFTNNGSIVTGSASASEALGFGLWSGRGSAVNNGRIEAVTGLQGMGATGGNLTGPMVNNGVIRAFSSAIEQGGAPYLWRAVGFGAGASLVNSGTIEAVSLHGEAFGIWTGTIGSQIVNSGLLYVSGARYEVTGIRAGQSWQNRIENSGTIHVVSTDPALQSVAISIFRDNTNVHQYGTVINSGTIVADVAIRAYAGYMTGIHVTNSGHIEGALSHDWGLNIVTNLAGGEWIGELVFGLHQDVMVNSGTVTGNVTLGAMTDLFDGRGGSVSGLVDGGSGMDVLFGGAGADRLSGGSDMDRIEGGGGADQLAGGDGGDVFAYSGWADSSFAAPDFISDFQSGVDKLDFGRLGAVTLSFFADGASTLVQAMGQGGTLVVRVSGPAGAGDVINEAPLPGQVGSEGPDILAAGTGDAILNGRGGADVLLGGAGDDRLDGWTGADTMFGGAGDDGYWIDEDGDRAIELDGQGIDYVYTSVDYSLQAFIENISLMGTASIGALGNMLDNVITGNPGNNGLSGQDGDDVIIGGGGADEMFGGKGADRFVYTQVSDSVSWAFDNITWFESGIDKIDLTALSPTSITWVEFSNYWTSSYWNTVTIETPGGTMTIRVSGPLTLADFLTGGGTLGTDGDDNLTALTGPAELYGFGGNDTLTGSGAADLLDGGTGADRMRGLGGDDLYLVDNPGDVVTELPGEGDDEVRSALADYVLADHVERLTLVGSGAVNGTGNGLANRIEGTPHSNRIDGGAGADTMVGGDGADTYVVSEADDRIVELFDQGQDWVYTALASYTLPDHVETVTGTAATGQVLTGNDGPNALLGGAGDDQLWGGGQVDVLNGGAGNDRLDGGSSEDSLTGGTGDDLYFVDGGVFLPSDNVYENEGEGRDEVRTALAAYTLAANVEILTGTSAGGQALTGNGLANTVAGGSGNDRLDGGAGADHLAGGLGDDVYIVDSGDSIAESETAGTDEVLTALAAFTLGANLENLTGISATGQMLNGNALANRLTGAAGNDVLDGGAGPDRLEGGLGNDLYLVGTDDIVVEAAGAGTDEVRTALASYALTADVENLTGTSATGQSLTGNGLANLLSGGAGNDLLDGGEGADQLSGGQGDDVYVVDSGDLVVEAANGGTDEVRTALAAYTLAANVETLTGLSAAGQSLTGNDLANLVSGGQGNDIIDGAGADDVLNGGAGDDTLRGGAGNDRLLFSGTGSEVAEGGSGADILVLSYGDSAAAVTMTAPGADPAGGHAGALSGSGRSLSYSGIEIFDVATGSGNDFVWGGSGDDRFSLGAGDDLFNHSGGIDTVDGGAGLDGISGLYGAGGLAISWNLVTGAHNGRTDLYTGFEYFHSLITGSGQDSITTANVDAADSLVLGANNDTAILWNGHDIVNGGAAAAGAADSGFDTLVLNYGSATGGVRNGGALTGNGAGYSGQFSDGATRSATFEAIDRFLIATGSGADDIFTGSGNDEVRTGGGNDVIASGAGNDLLDGGTGDDSMTGGAGNDTYVVSSLGDLVVEAAGEGADEVRTALAVYSLGANVENLTATSNVNHDFRGNSGANRIEGGSGNDVLRLYDGGADVVLGGGGDDIIFFIGALDSGDVVNGGGGMDTLVLQGPYGSLTLSPYIFEIENVSLLGGNNTNFGEPGTNRYDYVLTTNDSNFAAGVQARINGAALLEGEDFTFNGSAETNASFVVYGGKGVDTLTGGLGNDIFFYAEERFATGDTVNGGAGYDGMFLRGNYTIDFNAPGYTGLFTNIENLTLTSATDERYARGGGTEFDYNLTLSDAIVKPGETLTISGALLMTTETMILDAGQEADGFLRLFGGRSNDTLKGGANADLIHGNLGADQLTGNGGADTFRIDSTAESGPGSMDQITDFTPGTDKIDLSRIDANGLAAGDQAFAWIGSNAFSGSAGQLRAYEQGGTWFVEGDVNGDGVADFGLVLTLQGPTPLGAGDFLP